MKLTDFMEQETVQKCDRETCAKCKAKRNLELLEVVWIPMQPPRTYYGNELYLKAYQCKGGCPPTQFSWGGRRERVNKKNWRDDDYHV